MLFCKRLRKVASGFDRLRWTKRRLSEIFFSHSMMTISSLRLRRLADGMFRTTVTSLCCSPARLFTQHRPSSLLTSTLSRPNRSNSHSIFPAQAVARFSVSPSAGLFSQPAATPRDARILQKSFPSYPRYGHSTSTMEFVFRLEQFVVIWGQSVGFGFISLAETWIEHQFKYRIGREEVKECIEPTSYIKHVSLY